MVVASVAQLLGVKDVTALPFEPVRTVTGETNAVNPGCGYGWAVMVKVNGTPDCPVPSFAVMVTGELPAVNEVTLFWTVIVGAAME
jgi:hypothetical protein